MAQLLVPSGTQPLRGRATRGAEIVGGGVAVAVLIWAAAIAVGNRCAEGMLSCNSMLQK